MSAILGFVLDAVIIVLLGVTIHYALKLSTSLNNFRAHRQEFDKLLDELTRHLSDAHRAIHSLKTTGADAGKNLAEITAKSRKLVDELQIMNESGERLAQRLESAAGMAQRPRQERAAENLTAPSYPNQPARANRFGTDDGPSFSIQDRDHGNMDDDIGEAPAEEDGGDLPPHLQSQAEKELYRALQKKKSSGRLS